MLEASSDLLDTRTSKALARWSLLHAPGSAPGGWLVGSRSQALQERAKLGDLRALDEIASQTKQYRPTTCYPYQQCQLQGKDPTTQKRADSCGKMHVKAKRSSDRANLTYLFPGQQPKKYKSVKCQEPIWFHQQFIDTFTTFGDFRVFIFVEPRSTSLRGRQGKIVCMTHKVWSSVDNEEIYAPVAQKSYFQ